MQAKKTCPTFLCGATDVGLTHGIYCGDCSYSPNIQLVCELTLAQPINFHLGIYVRNQKRKSQSRPEDQEDIQASKMNSKKDLQRRDTTEPIPK